MVKYFKVHFASKETRPVYCNSPICTQGQQLTDMKEKWGRFVSLPEGKEERRDRRKREKWEGKINQWNLGWWVLSRWWSTETTCALAVVGWTDLRLTILHFALMNAIILIMSPSNFHYCFIGGNFCYFLIVVVRRLSCSVFGTEVCPFEILMLKS